MAGRGFGKTRCGAEFIRRRVEAGQAKRIHLVAQTAADARDTMIEGESGLLSVFPEDQRPVYEPSKRRVTFKNGAIAILFSAEEPRTLRGPQCDTFWADELASWKYPQDTWDMLMMGFRLGNPQGVITTTPRPIPLIRELVGRVGDDAVLTTGTTYDNAGNLPKKYFDAVIKRYEGTRLGRQELYAEILDDCPGALWHRGVIDDLRVPTAPLDLRRVVVAVDPAVSSNAKSDETGIVVAALGRDGAFYVLADLSGTYTPNEWAKRVCEAFKTFKADRVIAEANQGGELVSANLRTVDASIPIKLVHASRGKSTRAEPISALYEQRRVHHVGSLPRLEDQQCTWDPGAEGDSPDRVDALVWALTELSGRSANYTGLIRIQSPRATSARY